METFAGALLGYWIAYFYVKHLFKEKIALLEFQKESLKLKNEDLIASTEAYRKLLVRKEAYIAALKAKIERN